MINFFLFLIAIMVTVKTSAGPTVEMNKAFKAITDLIPYMQDELVFSEKYNQPTIKKHLGELQAAFKAIKHDKVIRQDLFAPSYELLNLTLSNTIDTFNKGHKEYALWQLQGLTNMCIECHTRLPPDHASSFEVGGNQIDPSKLKDPYSLGISYLIVRRYVDAKASFVRTIQDKIIKKDMKDIILPFKQILLIEAKVLKNPNNLIAYFGEYSNRNDLPEELRKSLREWIQRVKYWQKKKLFETELKTDEDVWSFIKKELIHLKTKETMEERYDVDLLLSSGLLSHYLFNQPNTPVSSEITYWIGWIEKVLGRDDFYSSGDLFFKQCIRRYPQQPVALRCLEEYRESVEFEFSGSSGTHIPDDVKKELNELSALIKKNEKK